MTTYPGDDPQPDDVPRAAEPDETEPTQPVGYWERRARDEAAEQGGQPYPTTPYTQAGPVFNPTSTQGSPPPPQAQPAPPPQPAPGYAPGFQGGSPAYGQGSYGQVPYGQPTPPSYGGQPAGPTPGQPMAPGQPAPYLPMSPYGGYVPPPDHPQSTLALVLGLVGVIGAFILCLPLVVAPFAWVIGHGALKDIRASQGRLGGESNARTGMILGIIGTVLLILFALIIFLAIVIGAVSEPSSTGGSSV